MFKHARKCEGLLQDWLLQEDTVELPSYSVVLSSGHSVQFVAQSTSEKYPILCGPFPFIGSCLSVFANADRESHIIMFVEHWFSLCKVAYGYNGGDVS